MEMVVEFIAFLYLIMFLASVAVLAWIVWSTILNRARSSLSSYRGETSSVKRGSSDQHSHGEEREDLWDIEDLFS